MGYQDKGRRSIRLPGYDYSQPGAYFVTICTQGRACVFGEIVDGEMQLNAAGRMVKTVWDDIPTHYPGVDIDACVIMPNHIHGIIVLVGAAPRGRPNIGADGRPGVGLGGNPDSGRPHEAGQPQGTGQPQGAGQPQGVAPTISLPDVVHRFKTMTTKRYADGVYQSGWTPFPGRLWQRGYYEHIIRNEESLGRIRAYIEANPLAWALDRENPMAVSAPPNSAAGEDEPWRV
ncbi:MAG: transposase [Anaerolineales bacterium]|nr:transposase [Anaerolineales bacterium]